MNFTKSNKKQREKLTTITKFILKEFRKATVTKTKSIDEPTYDEYIAKTPTLILNKEFQCKLNKFCNSLVSSSQHFYGLSIVFV